MIKGRIYTRAMKSVFDSDFLERCVADFVEHFGVRPNYAMFFDVDLADYKYIEKRVPEMPEGVGMRVCDGMTRGSVWFFYSDCQVVA